MFVISWKRKVDGERGVVYRAADEPRMFKSRADAETFRQRMLESKKVARDFDLSVCLGI